MRVHRTGRMFQDPVVTCWDTELTNTDTFRKYQENDALPGIWKCFVADVAFTGARQPEFNNDTQ